MPVKINDATINRPDGKRLIDAPAVHVNIEDFVDQLKDESAWKKSDRNGITVFKTPGLTMVLSAFHKGAEINDLQLEGLIILQVIEGEISVSTTDDEKTVQEKQILILHPESNHKLVAEKESIVLLSAMKESGDAVM